jgi:hypothetical protein
VIVASGQQVRNAIKLVTPVEDIKVIEKQPV